jgi:hypothetical protein
MFKKTFVINHTRIERKVTITNTYVDIYNHMNIVIEFEHSLPINYFLDASEITFGLYLDREFMKEFHGDFVKVPLENIDVNYLVEVFAHPHEGFEFIREHLKPGNKILITFKARDPSKKDIKKHIVYWDNKTGSYLAKTMGEVDANTGTVSGLYLRSGKIL